jgi:hypothetical protein
MIIVLSRLPRKPNVQQQQQQHNQHLQHQQQQSSLSPENIIRAIRVQMRDIRYSQAAHVLIVRAGLFR